MNTDGQLSRADLSGNLSKQFGQYVQTDIPLIRHGQLGGQVNNDKMNEVPTELAVNVALRLALELVS